MRVKRLPEFETWFRRLRDDAAVVRIGRRIDRLKHGNPGDHKSVGDGLMELRIDCGPGYRVYYIQRGNILIVVLCGGDKSSQASDIRRAKELAKGF